MATFGVKEVCRFLILSLTLDYVVPIGSGQVLFPDENQDLFEPRRHFGFGHGQSHGLGHKNPKPTLKELGAKVKAHFLSYSADQPHSLCSNFPESPINAKLTCTGTSCQVNCMRNYRFASGEEKVTLTCDASGRWLNNDNEWDRMQSCEPVCMPACANNGICVQPGLCACAENFIGPSCEKKKQYCLSPPAMPKNSKLTIVGVAAVVTCMRGYRFPDGTSVTNMECIDGAWRPSRLELKVVPDCQPICTEPCLNGGQCISHDVCQCLATYRGPQCQYDVESCLPKRMQFNGAYNCNGDNNQLRCSISCPAGVEFEFEPAAQYVCTYATGQFIPEKIPQCQFTADMDVVPLEGSSHTFTKISEKSGGSSTKKTKKRVWKEDEDEYDEEGGFKKIITKTKVTIIKKGRKKTNKGHYVEMDENGDEVYEGAESQAGVFVMYESKAMDIRYRIPKPAVCMTWNGNKVKTFDGLTYTSNLYCAHTLVQDAVDGSFSVVLRSCPYYADQNEDSCKKPALVLILQSARYSFEVIDDLVQLKMDGRPLPIPIQKPGIQVSMLGHKLKVAMDSVGLIVLWDTDRVVTVEATAQLWNRTAGLCGTLDQDVMNEFRSRDGTNLKMSTTFVDSWAAPSVDQDSKHCMMNDQPNQGANMELQCTDEIRASAERVCRKLTENAKFSNCLKQFDQNAFLESCISDYCFCSDQKNPTKCACEGVSVFAKDCHFRGNALEHGWRDLELCPMQCDRGRVYHSCGPLFEPSCGSTIDEVSTTCNEGCFCPEGMLQHEGKCVYIETCPCLLRGKKFQPGETIKKDCNTCKCTKGTWHCSDLSCGSRCAAVGDPHYQTFDGKRFDFMGKCSYVLMSTEGYSIEAENVACSGALSASIGFATFDQPSCTKSVTIKLLKGDQIKTVKLKYGRVVLIDGLEVTKLPTKKYDDVLKVRQASSTMILVSFVDGLNVWWDGISNVYIDAPASYRGRTKGLCGTFNSDIHDDFLTPEGDVESSVAAFADKWRTKESCQFAPNLADVPHPCQVNVENKERAIKACMNLKSKWFDECHWSVNPEEFYDDCMYDVCSCKGDDISQCLCPVLTAYASECSRQGVILNWRHSVSVCAIKCPAGQVFEECGDSCYRSCEDLQSSEPCHTTCVEGCRCPAGQSLDERNECVPTATCSCVYQGLTFIAGYKEVRAGKRYLELCTCLGASWKCKEATDGDAVKYPPAADQKARCLAVNNEVFTTCEPIEPKTCKNMNTYQPSTAVECRAGCVCVKNYVFDSFSKKCVLPNNCACHHGNKSYKEGDSIKEECNSCVCHNGMWECTKNDCPGSCTSWGDTHFVTFDGIEFDFQGVCSYVLSKGTLINGDGFTISIQNVLCGSLGVTCSKSVTVAVVGTYSESVTLNADQKSIGAANLDDSASQYKRLSIYNAGVFTIIEVSGMGLQVKWDRGTRVYVKLANQWRGSVKGLCGNFNGNAKDDMKTPSGGIETSAVIFGDSWKMQDYCEKPTEQIDTCKSHPERQVWAQRQCGILKSEVFKACNNEVSVDAFMKRCIHDTCACDQGGDCECLCTAIAAYAHVCSTHGIAIRWRTPTMCPMQCDVHCSDYTPCLQSSCPVETCDNLLVQAKEQLMCAQDTCVEGCQLKGCPEGHIYLNQSYAECVPASVCKPTCLVLNGVTYFEGDVIETDTCHTCRCTRGKKTCTGVPCTTTTPLPTTTLTTTVVPKTARPYKDSEDICKSGWSQWLNQDSLNIDGFSNTNTKYGKNNLKFGDEEPLPTEMILRNLKSSASCSQELMRKIECRTVDGHLTPKETGEDVECSLERGLRGFGECHDFETRVYCDCGDEFEVITLPTIVDRKPTEKYVATSKWTLTTIRSLNTTRTPPLSTTKAQFVPTTIPPATTKAPWNSVSQKCDPSVPHVEYPGDCYKFLHCLPATDGSWKYAEKTCGPTMMFNPAAMVCDWIASVKAMKPDCGFENVVQSTVRPIVETTTKKVLPPLCPAGQMWSECAVPCGKSCHYYGGYLRKLGVCHSGSHNCEPGCVDIGTVDCQGEQIRRDGKTCVDVVDCTCMSHNGKVAKPGVVHRETDCKTCQCIDNEFICDTSLCSVVPPKQNISEAITVIPHRNESTTTTLSPIIVPWTSTPPSKCDQSKVVPMINGKHPLPDTAFTSSSNYGNSFQARFAKLNAKPTDKSGGSWAPSTNDSAPYLQINFAKPTPLFGVIMQGSPIFDQFVTSFKILHSHDGNVFHYLVEENTVDTPQLFRGPIDNRNPVETPFQVPIEAKSVRVYPLTWHESVAVRLELLGCNTTAEERPLTTVTTTNKSAKTTTTPKMITTPKTSTTILTTRRPHVVETTEKPMCDEPMGLDNGIMIPDQVEVSSHKTSSKPFELLKLTAPNGWSPKLNTLKEYVLFDFLEPRMVTGLQSKGGPAGWVTVYRVEYSLDRSAWNAIEDDKQKPRQFLANFDEYSLRTNTFEKPVNTRYLKVVPLKWHESIQMKIEPIGCFKPYPLIVPKPEIVTEPPFETECGICKGVMVPKHQLPGICQCYSPLHWNGNECVSSAECPCMVGHIAYNVGSKYELDDCSECNCVLGGEARCKPQKCPDCAKGLRPDASIPCVCQCKPCPDNHVMCETSKTCIPENSWCDGIQDCPDDERQCKKEPPKVVTKIKEKITIITTCPKASCPPGFTIKHVPRNATVPKTTPMFQQSPDKYKPKPKETIRDDECIEFKCIPENSKPDPKSPAKPIKCPKEECPHGYDVVLDNDLQSMAAGKCAKFTCEPQLKEDVVCNVTARTFNTFDGTEFKYDICNHVLARDLISENWIVSIVKDCSIGSFVCNKEILIQDRLANSTIHLFPNLTLKVDDFSFTVAQLQQSNSPKLKSFTVSKVGNTLIFVSHTHSFWVIIDDTADVKIGLASNLVTKVDGLCGFFNNMAIDDKRLPNGQPADSTVSFGDAWFIGKTTENSSELCEPHACPKDMQDMAWNMCNAVKHDSFKVCSKNGNLDSFVMQCMESTCECLMAAQVTNKKLIADSKEAKQCKCSALQNFASNCLANDESIHLDTWRSVHECKAECPSGLVHRDCYRRRCEPTCDSTQSESEDCPTLPGTCFPGCYCPEGTVRKGTECVPLTACRNCVCDGFGESQYLTYDRKNFTFDGNCTYLLSRDLQVKDVHTFQVYASLGACEKPINMSRLAHKKSSCTLALHILYGPHIVHLQKEHHNAIKVLVDGIEVKKLPLNKDWINIIANIGQDIKIQLPKSHVDLSATFVDMSFAIRVPSIKYGSKMEGLCGDCNGNPSDDLKANPKATKPVKSDSTRDVIQSWLADDPKFSKEQICISEDNAVSDCIPLPPDEDPCMELIDDYVFGRCNLIVDPIMHLSACQQDICKTGPDQLGACSYLSKYAQECSQHDICVDWKRGKCNSNMTCPIGMTYQACGCAKTCEMIIKKASIKLNEKCPIAKVEGCFCPEGHVNLNGKCVTEKQCQPCDLNGHFVGDTWSPDKCTECSCNSEQQTKCIKRECPQSAPACGSGFKQTTEQNAAECCPIFKCVATNENKPVAVKCKNATIPVCAEYEVLRNTADANGCPRLLCKCIPYEQCPPLIIHNLKPGESMSTDTTGCCPIHKIVCDKHKCPAKPDKCELKFYEVNTVPALETDQCCPLYECLPPKDACIVELKIENKTHKTLKTVGDVWTTSNACLTERCSYGPNGQTEILQDLEKCSTVICQPGWEMKTSQNECCGICEQTECLFDGLTHKVNHEWNSPDNCTQFACIKLNGTFVVNSMKESCPDLTDCPDNRRYFEGCCQRCKPEALDQILTNCEATSLGDSATIKLVEKPTKLYGMCRNLQPIRGFTECNGRCISGTRYNKANFKQSKKCDCCTVANWESITVPLTCDTGFILDLVLSVPKACSCQPCDEEAGLLDVRSAF